MAPLGAVRYRHNSRMQRASAGAALLALVLTTAACSSDTEGGGSMDHESASRSSGEEPTADGVLKSADGTVVLVASEPAGSGDAVIAGTVVVINGCLGLRIGSNEYTAIWPVGTTVEPGTPVAVALPGGEVVREGSAVDGSGGFLTGELPSWAPAIPGSCDASAEIAAMVVARAQ